MSGRGRARKKNLTLCSLPSIFFRERRKQQRFISSTASASSHSQPSARGGFRFSCSAAAARCLGRPGAENERREREERVLGTAPNLSRCFSSRTIVPFSAKRSKGWELAPLEKPSLVHPSTYRKRRLRRWPRETGARRRRTSSSSCCESVGKKARSFFFRGCVGGGKGKCDLGCSERRKQNPTWLPLATSGACEKSSQSRALMTERRAVTWGSDSRHVSEESKEREMKSEGKGRFVSL